jgi:hypothetical protein
MLLFIEVIKHGASVATQLSVLLGGPSPGQLPEVGG